MQYIHGNQKFRNFVKITLNPVKGKWYFDNSQKHLLCNSYNLTLFRRDVSTGVQRVALPVRQAHVVVIDGQGHVLLKVFQTLRYEVFYPQRELQLVDLLLVGEVGEDGGPTPVLQRLEVSLEDSERHLCLGRSATDDREERFFNVLETSESHAQTDAVLEVGEGP